MLCFFKEYRLFWLFWKYVITKYACSKNIVTDNWHHPKVYKHQPEYQHQISIKPEHLQHTALEPATSPFRWVNHSKYCEQRSSYWLTNLKKNIAKTHTSHLFSRIDYLYVYLYVRKITHIVLSFLRNMHI